MDQSDKIRVITLHVLQILYSLCPFSETENNMRLHTYMHTYIHTIYACVGDISFICKYLSTPCATGKM